MEVIAYDRGALREFRDELVLERETRLERIADRWRVLAKQHEELEATLRVSFRESRYYQQLASEAGPVLRYPSTAFSQLPLLTRSTYRAYLEDIRIAARHLCFEDHTSGTSGRPISIFRDSRSVFLESIRLANILTYYAGDDRLLIPGRLVVLYVSHYPSSGEHIYEDPMLNGSYVVKIRCDTGNVTDRVQEMGLALGEGAYVLTGTPSSLIQFAGSDVARSGLPTPAAVLSSGEALSTAARAFLSTRFGVPVYQLYVLREFGTVGFECRRCEGFHLQADWFVVEVLDGAATAVSDGERGEIVITDLTNRHTPMLRYRTGDFGSIRWSRCDCGVSLPLMRELTGRRPVHFLTSHGQEVDTAIFAKQMDRLPVLWYRVTQSPQGSVLIEYCATEESSMEGLPMISQLLADELKLTDPVASRAVSFQDAVQMGKSGGFFSRCG